MCRPVHQVSHCFCPHLPVPPAPRLSPLARLLALASPRAATGQWPAPANAAATEATIVPAARAPACGGPAPAVPAAPVASSWAKSRSPAPAATAATIPDAATTPTAGVDAGCGRDNGSAHAPPALGCCRHRSERWTQVGTHLWCVSRRAGRCQRPAFSRKCAAVAMVMALDGAGGWGSCKDRSRRPHHHATSPPPAPRMPHAAPAWRAVRSGSRWLSL